MRAHAYDASPRVARFDDDAAASAGAPGSVPPLYRGALRGPVAARLRDPRLALRFWQGKDARLHALLLAPLQDFEGDGGVAPLEVVFAGRGIL